MQSLIRLFVVAMALSTVLVLTAYGSDEALRFASESLAVGESKAPADLEEVTVLMNWFACPELGGYWQADAQDLGKAYGVDLHVKQGGPGIQTIPQVAAGEVKFGSADSHKLLLARAEGVPVVQVFGGLDRYPQCVMFRPNQNIDAWTDLDGHLLAVEPAAVWWLFIKGKYDLQNVDAINYMGSVAPFVHNEALVQQCYITNEPYAAKRAGLPVTTMMVASSGYNPYSAGLFTTEKVIREEPELVRAVVAAVQEGWAQFLDNPEAARRLIFERNPEMTAGSFEFAWRELSSGDYFADPIGWMRAERWQTLADQLRAAGVLTEAVEPGSAWTNEFLPRD